MPYGAQLVEAVAAIDRAQSRPRTGQVPGGRIATASVGAAATVGSHDGRGGESPPNQPSRRWPRSSSAGPYTFIIAVIAVWALTLCWNPAGDGAAGRAKTTLAPPCGE